MPVADTDAEPQPEPGDDLPDLAGRNLDDEAEAEADPVEDAEEAPQQDPEAILTESESESEDSDLPLPEPDLSFILTEDEMLIEGLYALDWTQKQIDRMQDAGNKEKFRGHYGADPHVIAQIWEDLITTDLPQARVDPKKRPLAQFFVALHFLKRYQTEIEKNTTWKKSKNTLRDWTWFFVGKIRALKALKIRWPSDNYGKLT